MKFLPFGLLAAAWCASVLWSCKKSPEKQPPPERSIEEKLEPVHLVLPGELAGSQEDATVYIQEKEPNDYHTWALLLEPGTSARGFINEPRMRGEMLGPDRDYYRFEVPADSRHILWARLTGVPGIDMFLSVHDSENKPIHMQDDNEAGREEIIVNLTLDPGTHYFVVGERWRSSVFKHDPKNPYTLRWRLTTPTPGQEIEPNNHRATANRLIPGRAMKGYIHSRNDVDFYQLDFGNRLMRMEFRTVAGLPLNVSFWPAEGKSPVLRKKVPAGESLVLRRMNLQEVGASFLAIAGAGRAYSVDGQYEIRVSYDTGGERFESEPNDSVSQANVLSGMSGTILGTISHARDRDFYSVNFDRDMSMNLSLSAPESLTDLQMCLMPLKRCIQAKDGNPLEIHHQVVAKGNYWLEVDSQKSFDPDATYSLNWRFQVASDADEREPNNRPEQAGRIHAGTLVRGFLLPKGDVDYFWFSLPGSSSNPPVVQVEMTGGESIDPSLAIVDRFGNVTVEDASGIYSGVRRVKTALHPGHRYYVRVRDKQGNAGSPNVPYLLRLTHVNAMPRRQYR